MQLKVTGVVVREMNLGESDRIVTILTKERGVVRAFARGSKRLGSRLFAATQPFCLSDFVLYHSKDKYILNEAQLATSFFKLRQDIERLSLAQYFCEVVSLIAPQEDEAEEWLRLTLNALHILQAGDKPACLIKAAFELRAALLAGYCPDLEGCAGCGAAEGPFYFYALEGRLLCERCGAGASGIVPLSPGVLAAMRHIVSCPAEKLFSFTLSPAALQLLGDVTERYLLVQTERHFKTLDFYHAVAAPAAQLQAEQP